MWENELLNLFWNASIAANVKEHLKFKKIPNFGCNASQDAENIDPQRIDATYLLSWEWLLLLITNIHRACEFVGLKLSYFTHLL